MAIKERESFDISLRNFLSVIWVKTIDGSDPWTVEKKQWVISAQTISYFKEELEQAAGFMRSNQKGIDWEQFIEAKAGAGFGKKLPWKFFDSREIFVQADSLWLKPQFGFAEDTMTWSARAMDLWLHGSSIEIQLYAGSINPINKTAKANLAERIDLEGGDEPKAWAQQLLHKYESLGHGINFQARVKRDDSDLIPILVDLLGFDISNMTFLWTSHTFAFLILHGESDFI